MQPASFNLFSENNSEAPAQYSSPVQETEKLKELRLERENKLLLQSRDQLLKEIKELERQWNEQQTLADQEAAEESDGEDEMIFDLLMKKAKSDAVRKEQENDDSTTEEEMIDANGQPLVEFDEEKFSTKPLKDWSLRKEYLKKFYPYLTITDVTSKLSLETDAKRKISTLIKTISFEINHGDVFIFDVGVKLYSKNNGYHIWRLDIVKKSNNRFNTILLSMVEYFKESKNINEFLFSVNSLYELVIERQKTITELNEDYNNGKEDESDDKVKAASIFNNEFRYRNLVVRWDLSFEKGEVYPLVSVNGGYNAVMVDMVDLYGVQRAIEMLIEEIYRE
ncbi:CYFA0S01e10572g1_1 [Cyberlindnera fabianii]|uniref:CYFA0S01e10572g1_1 n=1 Tax=Cyberlindnera fabianii TaxID=36022 RepID=A0A061AIQ0_CYBFA|nr:CYFA0S01e10572g1_1 [Cyberlindnera fabianii]